MPPFLEDYPSFHSFGIAECKLGPVAGDERTIVSKLMATRLSGRIARWGGVVAFDILLVLLTEIFGFICITTNF